MRDPIAVLLDRSVKYFTWYDPFREGLLCALLLDDEAGLSKLLPFADTDLAYDEGFMEVQPEDNHFLILLSFWLRGAEPEKQAMLKEKVRNKGRGKRAKLLLAGLESIEHRNLPELRKAMLAIAKYHRDKEFKTHLSPLYMVMVEGSILWNVARRAGMRLDDLPLDVMDRIMRPETVFEGQ